MNIKQKRKILKRSLLEGKDALKLYTKYEHVLSVPNSISTSIKVFLTDAELNELLIKIDDFGNPIIDVNDDDVLWLFDEYEKLYNLDDIITIKKHDGYSVVSIGD